MYMEPWYLSLIHISYAPTSASSSFLGKYCVDLIEDAANKLHPVINRDRENRMVMEILGSRSKSNVRAGVFQGDILVAFHYSVLDGEGLGNGYGGL